MRDIKFRGKTKLTKQWKYGYAFPCRYIKDENGKESYANIYVIGENQIYKVDTKSVGQYTGLKDKYNIEIYEGDIIQARYKEIRADNGIYDILYSEFDEEVVWDSNLNGFAIKIEIDDIPFYRPLNFQTYKGIDLVSIEVIGNVYDNPELLRR